MEHLIERIRNRLREGAYSNEAAVSVGIVMPLIQALGWDSSDPDSVVPEFTSGRGRVDFALCLPPRRPAVFVEVKGVGRSLEGDRQLFEYAFHQGVPLCLLTDGREWSFYLPGGQGDYDDRRVYRLQIDERVPAECTQVLQRYLQYDRVRSGEALEDATRDYRDAAARREAARSVPQAWAELVAEQDELLVELVADKAEVLCGYRPSMQEVIAFLSRVGSTTLPQAAPIPREGLQRPVVTEENRPQQRSDATVSGGLEYQIFGQQRRAPNANRLLVDVLSVLAARYPDQVPELALAVRGTSRNHIARTTAEIYPSRPDLARAEEFAPGWLVGLNIANREKIGIMREACRVFNIEFGRDVIVSLPNAM